MCPVISNNQKADGFCKEVASKFLAFMQKESYQGVNLMGSRHREMDRKISAFCGYYNNAFGRKFPLNFLPLFTFFLNYFFLTKIN
ncbi:hypothetical protein Hanom_Chr05g00462281 [Helianthus anomalus]